MSYLLAWIEGTSSNADGGLIRYVGVRVVHSLVHALFNPIMIRFSLFALSSIVFAGLTARAAQVLFF